MAWVASAAIANILGTLLSAGKEISPIRLSSFIPALTVSVMVGSFVLLCIHFAGVVGRAWTRKARHARRISVKSG